MLIHDRVTLTSRERTAEGYLRVSARLSRTGLQDYARGEIGFDGDPRGVVRMYRPDSEVFDADSMASFAMKPVTIDHPDDLVTLGNFKDLAVGFSGENISRDGQFLRGSLLVTDAAAISAIESGLVEISLGYTLELDMTPGKTPDGQAYDAVQRKIRGNHIALVDAGRCGGECRLDDRKRCGDGSCGCASCKRQNEESEMTDKPNSFMVDGVPVTTLDEAKEVIARKDKLIADSKESLVGLRDKLLDQQKDHAKAIEAKDDQIAKLKSEVSDAKLDERAEQRLELVMKAADYLPESYDTKGKSNAQIAKDALSELLGADAVAGKSDSDALAMFSMLDAKQKDGVSLADALLPKNRVFAGDNGRAEYLKNLNEAHKAPALKQ